jgi:hypothetical protein
LCGSMLAQRAAHSTLRNLHLTADEINASPLSSFASKRLPGSGTTRRA